MGSTTIPCYSLVWVCGVFSLGACSWPRVGAQRFQSHYEVNNSHSSSVGSKPSSWVEHGFINWQIRKRKIVEEREVDAFPLAVSYWRVAGNGGEQEKAGGRSCCRGSETFWVIHPSCFTLSIAEAAATWFPSADRVVMGSSWFTTEGSWGRVRLIDFGSIVQRIFFSFFL